MRRALLGAAMVLGLAVLWVSSYAFAQNAAPGGAPAAPAWEYRLVNLMEVVDVQKAVQEPANAVRLVESKFNELGRDGWEYVGDLPGASIFKRSKR